MLALTVHTASPFLHFWSTKKPYLICARKISHFCGFHFKFLRLFRHRPGQIRKKLFPMVIINSSRIKTLMITLTPQFNFMMLFGDLDHFEKLRLSWLIYINEEYAGRMCVFISPRGSSIGVYYSYNFLHRAKFRIL